MYNPPVVALAAASEGPDKDMVIAVATPVTEIMVFAGLPVESKLPFSCNPKLPIFAVVAFEPATALAVLNVIKPVATNAVFVIAAVTPFANMLAPEYSWTLLLVAWVMELPYTALTVSLIARVDPAAIVPWVRVQATVNAPPVIAVTM
jgi:hypothetical protein